MEFSRQEYWSGLSFPSSGDLPDPGIKPMSLTSPALAGGFFTTSATWELPLLVGLQSGTPILIARCLLFTCILEMSPCLPPCESYPALSPCTGSNTVFFWFFPPTLFSWTAVLLNTEQTFWMPMFCLSTRISQRSLLLMQHSCVLNAPKGQLCR